MNKYDEDSLNRDLAENAGSDVKLAEELSQWLLEYEYQVFACGRNGDLERQKCKDLSIEVIKRLTKYI